MHVCVCICQLMYLLIYVCMCHKGVVFQTLGSIVHAQGTSHQYTSNQKKTNN